MLGVWVTGELPELGQRGVLECWESSVAYMSIDICLACHKVWWVGGSLHNVKHKSSI